MKNTLAIFLLCCFSAFADTPSVTPGNPGDPTTLNTFYAYTDSHLIYWFPTITTNCVGLNEIGGGQLDSVNTFSPLQVSFAVSNTSSVDWESVHQAYGTYLVSATDGRTNYFGARSVQGSYPNGLYPRSSPTFYLVTLPYVTNWFITIRLAMDDGFSGLMAGIDLPTGASLMATNTFPAQRKLVVFGDSYAKGYDPQSGQSYPNDGAQFLSGFAMDLEQLGSNIKVFPAGVGGQGYVTTNGTPSTYQGRTTNDVANIAPLFVLVTGSINDEGVSTNTLYNAALLLYGTIKSNLPSANIAVIGTWYKDASPSASMIANDQMQQAAAAFWSLNYVSPVQQAWGQGGVGSDGVHPTAAQYMNYANRISTNMTSWYGTNWIFNYTPPAPPPSGRMAIRWK